MALSVRSYIMTLGSIPTEIVTAAIFGVIVAAVLGLLRAFAPRLAANLPGYLLTLLIAIAVATTVRFWQGYLPDYPNLNDAQDLFFAIVRMLVGILMLQAIIGVLQDRLQRQVVVTQDALDLVERQAEALLKADEEVRRSVATLLHDRVQGGLLAACIRLQAVAQQSPEVRAEVERVIHELEELRALDVRRAVRTLSPSLKDVDLETAIRELVEPYSPALSVDISIPRDAIEDPTARLAAYRIIEQGVLNAVGHGQAQRVAISVRPTGDRVDLAVADDGTGLAPKHTTGFGSMLIDTWCRTLGGTWHLRQGTPRGAVLTAQLPARDTADVPAPLLG